MIPRGTVVSSQNYGSMQQPAPVYNPAPPMQSAPVYNPAPPMQQPGVVYAPPPPMTMTQQPASVYNPRPPRRHSLLYTLFCPWSSTHPQAQTHANQNLPPRNRF